MMTPNNKYKAKESPSMYYANLHLHSTYSDAGFTPQQLVRIGKSLGYGALALTDHETDAGCEEFIHYAKKEGLEAITGTEFYGVVDGCEIHLTALDFDPTAPSIREFIQNRCDVQNAWVRHCVERGLELGYISGITWDDVVFFSGEGAWLCVDSVFLALRLKKAMPADTFADIRQNVFKAPEVKAIKPQMPAAEDVIQAVRKANGVIALAHPRANMTDYIQKLVDAGLNGIETCHPSISAEAQPLADEAARNYNLYHCGGTDHTGPMSCCGGKYAIPAFQGISEENFRILTERRLG